MSPPPAVLAIVVNWNGLEVLAKALESLARSDYPHLDVLVVDSASSDGSESLVEQPVRLLKLEENQGFATAVNRGIESATANYQFFLVLNNDVEVAPDMVSRLVACAQRCNAGVCGPQVLRSQQPDRLDAAWGRVLWHHVLAHYQGRNRPADQPPWNRPRTVELLLGCALLIDRRVIESVGLFDERYFMYHEEVDYLYRTSRAGWRVEYCPAARLLHHGAHSTASTPDKKAYWVRRNTIYFLRKHGAGVTQWGFYWSTSLASLLFNLMLFRWRRARVIGRATRDGLRGQQA